MRCFAILLVCGLLMVANGANAGPLAENMDRLIQDGIKIQKMRDRQRRTEILRQSEQERLRIERARLELQKQQLRVPQFTERSQADVKTGIAKNRAEVQTSAKPSAWFLISMGANKKWKINDTFEQLAECKKHRAVDPTNTLCIPSDTLGRVFPSKLSTSP